METFIALCDWLQVQPGELFVTHQKQQQQDTDEEIIILLLGDKRLDRDTSYALAQIIKATYRYLLE
ncbi:MAG: hypothetical protein PUP90_26035 [Nostoc sp. S4]|nr:hypothetical protein [Nostoc sp. S4]